MGDDGDVVVVGQRLIAPRARAKAAPWSILKQVRALGPALSRSSRKIMGDICDVVVVGQCLIAPRAQAKAAPVVDPEAGTAMSHSMCNPADDRFAMSPTMLSAVDVSAATADEERHCFLEACGSSRVECAVCVAWRVGHGVVKMQQIKAVHGGCEGHVWWQVLEGDDNQGGVGESAVVVAICVGGFYEGVAGAACVPVQVVAVALAPRCLVDGSEGVDAFRCEQPQLGAHDVLEFVFCPGAAAQGEGRGAHD